MDAAANNMDDDSFMQWAMDTLLQAEEEEEEPAVVDAGGCGDGEAAVVFPSLQALRDASHAAEMVRELMVAAADAHDAPAANSWTTTASGSGGEVTDGGSIGANDSFARAAPAPAPALPSGNGNGSLLAPVSWNFVTGSAQPDSGGVPEDAAVPVPARSVPPELVAPRRRSPPPPRRAHHPVRGGMGLGASSPASCTPDHIVAERKRREKINKRLIELSTVIPGLKKMDKATILSDAAKYVKELQQRVKALEEEAAAAGGGGRRRKAPRPTDENGGSQSPTSASSSASSGAAPAALPEIEARVSERSAMVRVHCRRGKGVAVAVLGVVEGLGLTVVHANVMPFSACTIVMIITAEIEGRVTLTTEHIVGKLKSALSAASP